MFLGASYGGASKCACVLCFILSHSSFRFEFQLGHCMGRIDFVFDGFGHGFGLLLDAVCRALQRRFLLFVGPHAEEEHFHGGWFVFAARADASRITHGQHQGGTSAPPDAFHVAQERRHGTSCDVPRTSGAARRGHFVRARWQVSCLFCPTRSSIPHRRALDGHVHGASWIRFPFAVVLPHGRAVSEASICHVPSQFHRTWSRSHRMKLRQRSFRRMRCAASTSVDVVPSVIFFVFVVYFFDHGRATCT
mmetsp:Transcript_172/g.1287  ORF Transcript_172/g.1287 Transcript_172/m.1287 type:complete len:249 (+) Transcript_172:1669-2415(+)